MNYMIVAWLIVFDSAFVLCLCLVSEQCTLLLLTVVSHSYFRADSVFVFAESLLLCICQCILVWIW